MEEVKKENRGGKRREGRTMTKRTIEIDNDLLVMLNEVKNKQRFVNEAIREKFEKKE